MTKDMIKAMKQQKATYCYPEKSPLSKKGGLKTIRNKQYAGWLPTWLQNYEEDNMTEQDILRELGLS